MAAKLLTKLGYNVKSVKGGMADWNKVYDISEIPVPDQALFRIWQIRRVSKGCISYVISSKEDNNALVIDPSREINESFQKLANDHKLKITKLLDNPSTCRSCIWNRGVISNAFNRIKQGCSIFKFI